MFTIRILCIFDKAVTADLDGEKSAKNKKGDAFIYGCGAKNCSVRYLTLILPLVASSTL